MLQRLLGEDIEIQIVESNGPCTVTADPGQLEQVILNLALNARDAMPRGGRLVIETGCVSVSPSEAKRVDAPAGRSAFSRWPIAGAKWMRRSWRGSSSRFRVLLRNVLRRAGYEVLEAATPGEAILVVEQHQGPIDLLLTDVVMPRMDGRTLALGSERSGPR